MCASKPQVPGRWIRLWGGMEEGRPKRGDLRGQCHEASEEQDRKMGLEAEERSRASLEAGARRWKGNTGIRKITGCYQLGVFQFLCFIGACYPTRSLGPGLDFSTVTVSQLYWW